MKKIIAALMLFILFTLLLQAKNCWKINNKDTKALCESKFEHKKNCWLIKNSDIKAYCEASAYGKSTCWKIKNADAKEMCIAETGH